MVPPDRTPADGRARHVAHQDLADGVGAGAATIPGVPVGGGAVGRVPRPRPFPELAHQLDRPANARSVRGLRHVRLLPSLVPTRLSELESGATRSSPRPILWEIL